MSLGVPLQVMLRIAYAEITYDVSDEAGNAAAQATRTVEVVSAAGDDASKAADDASDGDNSNCFIRSVSGPLKTNAAGMVFLLLGGLMVVCFNGYWKARR